MAWAEETIKRGRKVKHFFDPETGLHRAELTIHDQHYHDGAIWQDVDELLVDDGLEGYDKDVTRLNISSVQELVDRGVGILAVMF